MYLLYDCVEQCFFRECVLLHVFMFGHVCLILIVCDGVNVCVSVILSLALCVCLIVCEKL